MVLRWVRVRATNYEAADANGTLWRVYQRAAGRLRWYAERDGAPVLRAGARAGATAGERSWDSARAAREAVEALAAAEASILRWSYRGEAYASPIVARCKFCRAAAVVELPPALLREQPDETTHVCHPGAGGCNQGFALDLEAAS